MPSGNRRRVGRARLHGNVVEDDAVSLNSGSSSRTIHRDQPPDSDSEITSGSIISDGQGSKRSRTWIGRVMVLVEELEAECVPKFTHRMRYLSFQVEYLEEIDQLYYNVFVDFINPLTEAHARAQLGLDNFMSEGHQFSIIPPDKTKTACKNRAISSLFRKHPTPFGQHGKFESTSKGTRTDLTRGMEVLEDRGFEALVVECPELVARYYRNFKELAIHFQNKFTRRGLPEDAPTVHIWWGATGAGTRSFNLYLYHAVYFSVFSYRPLMQRSVSACSI
jgi:hypothetical protein